MTTQQFDLIQERFRNLENLVGGLTDSLSEVGQRVSDAETELKGIKTELAAINNNHLTEITKSMRELITDIKAL